MLFLALNVDFTPAHLSFEIVPDFKGDLVCEYDLVPLPVLMLIVVRPVQYSGVSTPGPRSDGPSSSPPLMIPWIVDLGRSNAFASFDIDSPCIWRAYNSPFLVGLICGC